MSLQPCGFFGIFCYLRNGESNFEMVFIIVFVIEHLLRMIYWCRYLRAFENLQLNKKRQCVKLIAGCVYELLITLDHCDLLNNVIYCRVVIVVFKLSSRTNAILNLFFTAPDIWTRTSAPLLLIRHVWFINVSPFTPLIFLLPGLYY